MSSRDARPAWERQGWRPARAPYCTCPLCGEVVKRCATARMGHLRKRHPTALPPPADDATK